MKKKPNKSWSKQTQTGRNKADDHHGVRPEQIVVALEEQKDEMKVKWMEDRQGCSAFCWKMSEKDLTRQSWN